MQPTNDDPRTDHELVAALNRDEAGAFDVLYGRHRDWVMSLAVRITGDHALGLDVLQETFLYLLKKFPGFELTCQLRSFLYPAVRNLGIAARRKAARVQSEDGAWPELEAPTPAVTGDAARDHLSAVVAGLPATHREVLLLRFVDGLSLQEIAEALEIPTGTVKSRLHNALESLRRDPRTEHFFEP